jgi:rubrerythrin
MGIKLNANEVFEMAEQIERNAAKFYRQAAGNSSGKDIKQMLLELADMEDGHQKTFAKMREQLGGGEKGWTVFDPEDQSVLYLQAMADSRGYEGKISPTKELTGSETIREVLEIALNSEKESVLFYFGLKDLVSAKAGKEKVEAIIKEELSHITTLLNSLNSL